MGNTNYKDAALSNQTLPVQVSEAANNTPPFVDVIEEMSKPYVQDCKQVYPDEEMETAIRYLNTLGGISQHRNHKNLLNAIKHVRHMREKNRINDLGLPDDFSRERLVEVFDRTRYFEMDDVMHAVNQCLAGGYFPDPYECAEKSLELKNIDISQHGNHGNIFNAIQHVHTMRDIERINEFGLPDNFSRESLVEILVRTGHYEMDDVIYAVNQCLVKGFFPHPYECAEKICAMKGIEELRNEVGEKRTELIHCSDVFARSQSVMIQELVMRDL